MTAARRRPCTGGSLKLGELTLGGLISARLLRGTLGLVSTVADDLLVTTWVDLLAPARGA